MHIRRVFRGLLALLSTVGALAQRESTSSNIRRSFSDNYTDAVTWDPYSLSLLGQRIFILSGEVHPFRLPVPSLWRDILEKAKASGLNTVSIYTHWALSNPSEGALDFDGFRSLTLFLEMAQEVGLWVIVRAASLHHVSHPMDIPDQSLGSVHQWRDNWRWSSWLGYHSE
jgi:beta-galactosidase GanA